MNVSSSLFFFFFKFRYVVVNKKIKLGFKKNQICFCCVKKVVFREKIQICFYLIKTTSFNLKEKYQICF